MCVIVISHRPYRKELHKLEEWKGQGLLHKLWDWAKWSLTTDEINNKFLFATDMSAK
jgi:hypothetical protein